MNKLITFILSISICAAQNVDYNKIILPDGVKSNDFSERLVQLAWKNNPDNIIQNHNMNIARIDVKASGSKWLEIITLQGNLNEFTITEQARENSNAFFPRYNMNATLKLGTFFTIPYDVKKSKEQLKIAEAQMNSQKLKIRSIVMQAYNDVQTNEKVYKILSQARLDAEDSHKKVNQRFVQGEITFENYLASLNNLNNSKVRELEAESNYQNSKLYLESIIGVKLEEVN